MYTDLGNHSSDPPSVSKVIIIRNVSVRVCILLQEYTGATNDNI